jgi:hypothetical protein
MMLSATQGVVEISLCAGIGLDQTESGRRTEFQRPSATGKSASAKRPINHKHANKNTPLSDMKPDRVTLEERFV